MQIVDRRSSDSRKWNKYIGQDILPLWVADTDFAVATEIVEAVKARADEAVFGYGLQPPDKLTESACAHLRKHYQWSVGPEAVVWLPGLGTGLALGARLIANSGETLMINTPIYPPFFRYPEAAGIHVTRVPMQPLSETSVGEYAHTRPGASIANMQAALTPDTKGVLFCNPHNPGGTVYRRDELEALADFIISHDLRICSDDIHCDLILEPGTPHIPIASVNPEIAERTITLMAPSKTWNIPGLGCAFAVVENDNMRQQLRQLMIGIVAEVNVLGFQAALAAYQHGEPWRQQQLQYLRQNRDYLLREINAIDGLSLEYFESTYLAWIDVSALNLADPATFFEQAGIGMSAGIDFGSKDHMRLNFGCDHRMLETAIERIKAALT